MRILFFNTFQVTVRIWSNHCTTQLLLVLLGYFHTTLTNIQSSGLLRTHHSHLESNFSIRLLNTPESQHTSERWPTSSKRNSSLDHTLPSTTDTTPANGARFVLGHNKAEKAKSVLYWRRPDPKASPLLWPDSFSRLMHSSLVMEARSQQSMLHLHQLKLRKSKKSLCLPLLSWLEKDGHSILSLLLMRLHFSSQNIHHVN